MVKDYYFPENHTPAEWREMAHGRNTAAAESFERCDTDGFLSQWASGQMARVYDACADLAEAGGEWELDALEDLDGNEVKARIINTRFGARWGVLDEGDNVVVWLPFRPARKSTLEKKGYRETKRVKPAIVHTFDSGYNIGVEYVERRTK